MDKNSSISINPAKPSELEFEVTVQGLDDETPKVRFVVVTSTDTGDLLFNCTKCEAENTWCAKLPKLDHIESDSVPFRVEVIIDGYYFEPAEGDIAFIKAPDVQFAKKEKARPTVKTSFVVKQDDDTKTKSKEKKVSEASDDPTNTLLVPETDPAFDDTVGKPATGEKKVPDEAVNIEDIASDVTAGLNGIDGAGELIRTVPPKLERPEKPGSLFKRASNGKAMIPGLEDTETKAKLDAKAAKVRDILKATV